MSTLRTWAGVFLLLVGALAGGVAGARMDWCLLLAAIGVVLAGGLLIANAGKGR